ncbi:MAG: glycosyltransferase [Candidatus Pelagibacterales bacterium]|nr:MAG: glycosyltransferase [Pelagibacterales bacterium]
MNNFIILTPTFNDWKSLSKVLSEIEKNIKGLKGKFRTLIINDASNIRPKLHLKNISRLRKIDIITLKKNMGSQKSICIGLKYLKKIKTKAIITIIDSDGEDDPKKIKKLINLAIKNPNSVITANRSGRKESVFFKTLYRIHLFLTFFLTGKYINFGNYCSFNSQNLKKLLSNANLWLACSAGIKKNSTSIKSYYVSRKKRYFDSSKAKFSFLFKHSLSIISVFKLDVLKNSIIYCFILLLIFILTKNLVVFMGILVIVILNIAVYYQSKKIYNFQNCLNLIKHIKRY